MEKVTLFNWQDAPSNNTEQHHEFSIYDLDNMTVIDAFAKADTVIQRHNNIAVGISGGSDSDIVIDIVERLCTMHS